MESGRGVGVSSADVLSMEGQTLRWAAGLIRQAGDVAAEMPGVAPGFAAGVLATATLVESFAARAHDMVIAEAS